MSDFLKHECGIAAVRLRKPLAYYYDRYGTCLWGLNKLFLLMEKQHNRGQDGTGIGCVKLNMPIGQPYVHRRRGIEKDALAEIFRKEIKDFYKMSRKGVMDHKDPESVKKHFDFGGEILVGHLRYGTSGEFDEGSCHPYLRRSNWPTRTLMVMGNFNMTNAAELNEVLINRGQHPVFGTDTQTVLEEIGYHLDEAHTDLYRHLRDAGVPGAEMPEKISAALDVPRLVAESAAAWDGGYAICGVIGNGDMFVMRDPARHPALPHAGDRRGDRLRLRAGAAHDGVRSRRRRGEGGGSRLDDHHQVRWLDLRHRLRPAAEVHAVFVRENLFLPRQRPADLPRAQGDGRGARAPGRRVDRRRV